jgi:tellurite resistance protein
MQTAISPQDALIYAMVTTSAADRTMTDAELWRIGDVVKTLPMFTEFDPKRLVSAGQACSEILADEEGLHLMLDLIRDALPRTLYDTAYALAVEVAAADVHVEQEELRFLQLLRDHLELDKLTVAAIEFSARVRHRKVAPNEPH